MKRFFVLSITTLFVTTCLFLPNLIAEWNSESGWKNLSNNKGRVYGYVYVNTGWSFPFATSYHEAHLRNDAKLAVKYYATFTATVDGPSKIDPKQVEPEGWVGMGDFGYEDQNFRFNMRGKDDGWYTITGESDLDVKADTNGDGNFDSFLGWDTDTFTPFQLR